MHVSFPRVCVIREYFTFFCVIVDSGADPHHSHCLVGISPSTSPPPLGERNRRSKWTTSHIDSHTMGDHGDDTPKLPSPLRDVEDKEFNPTFDPSPDMAVHSGFDPSHDRPTHCGYDPSFTSHRYWMPGDETHHALVMVVMVCL